MRPVRPPPMARSGRGAVDRAARRDLELGDRIVERWDVAGSSLGYRVARAIMLLDLYGDQVFATAAADLIARGLSDVGALAVACEKHRKDLGRLVPLTLVLPDHLDDADVIPHDLESYDE